MVNTETFIFKWSYCGCSKQVKIRHQMVYTNFTTHKPEHADVDITEEIPAQNTHFISLATQQASMHGMDIPPAQLHETCIELKENCRWADLKARGIHSNCARTTSSFRTLSFPLLTLKDKEKYPFIFIDQSTQKSLQLDPDESFLLPMMNEFPSLAFGQHV